MKIVRPGRLAVAALVAASLYALPAFAGDVKVTKGALVIDGGQRFFRGKATDIALGSYGEKKTPVGQIPYLAIEKTLSPGVLGKVPIKITGPIAVDWSKVSSSDISAGVSFLKKGGGKGSLTIDAAKGAKLVLVKFSIAEGDLKDLLNKHATDSRDYLKKEGGDGRVVSEVYVAMEAELASSVTTGGSVSASGTSNGLQIEVAASGSSTTTTKVTLPPDTTFAYLLHKVKKWSNKVVDDMEDDRAGLN
ncbi:MAG: hypothetical protein HYV09_21115 [Deltaproteobacteria bacterium]|nr:hypothetical protein [Deltaproteobacteria bacterium]